MLNKEQKQEAEKMAGKIAPLFKEAAKLAGVWIKTYKARRYTEQVAIFWQYVGTDSEGKYCEDVGEEERNKARQTKAESRRTWSDILYAKYAEQSTAENNERAALANYINYLYFICENVGEMLRPYAWEIYQQKGDTFKQWAEILNTAQTLTEYTARRVYISIYLDSIFSDSICLDIHTNGAGACGAFSHIYKYYKPDTSEPREIAKPCKMTGKQWADRLAKLKQYEEKAREIQREQWRKARAWGMLDACELLDSPTTKKARR